MEQTWEHYSSIRNIDGPHTGLPNVQAKALSPEDDAKNKAAAAKVSYVLPWMINVVTQSLPYLADRETIKKTLEESKGNIDTAVSILLDAEERASVSSQPGSSCTERDPDSDHEEFVGPNKKQDRRMSRATKALRKEKAEQERRDTAQNATTTAEEEPAAVTATLIPAIELPVRQYKPILPKDPPRILKTEDDDEWATPSDDDGDGDFQPELDDINDDAASQYSDRSRSQTRILPPTAPKPLHITVHTTKTYQKQPGPQRKRQTARDRVEMRKAAQKAAQKERKRNGAQASRQLEVTSINVNKNPPPIDLGMGIKTLYI
jgi:OTU domain-containing protein 3